MIIALPTFQIEPLKVYRSLKSCKFKTSLLFSIHLVFLDFSLFNVCTLSRMLSENKIELIGYKAFVLSNSSMRM